MTLTDNLIPYYVWFVYGFGIVSILIGIVNFGMSLVTMITVKGIYIPLWMILVVAVLVIGFCTATGYFFEKYAIWSRITSHQNMNINPEIRQLCEDVRYIRTMAEKEKRE